MFSYRLSGQRNIYFSSNFKSFQVFLTAKRKRKIHLVLEENAKDQSLICAGGLKSYVDDTEICKSCFFIEITQQKMRKVASKGVQRLRGGGRWNNF